MYLSQRIKRRGNTVYSLHFSGMLVSASLEFWLYYSLYIYIYICMYIFLMNQRLFSLSYMSTHTQTHNSSDSAMEVIWQSYMSLCQRTPAKFCLYAESSQKIYFIWAPQCFLNVYELPTHWKLSTMSHEHPYIYYVKS